MRRQNGMSLSSILALLLIAVVAAKTAYTLIPMYWDNKLLTTVLDGMKESGDISATTSPKAVKDILSQRMNMNNIRIAFDELSIKKAAVDDSNWTGPMNAVIPGSVMLTWLSAFIST